MKLSEFSDSFDTLLNSYSTKAEFGDQSSRYDITLDEYEKSVFLTQAQDIIVKSYFDAHTNSQSQGFDDSERRQTDFSSLIKVESPLRKSREGKSCRIYDATNVYKGTIKVVNLMPDKLLNLTIYNRPDGDGMEDDGNGKIDILLNDTTGAGMTLTQLVERTLNAQNDEYQQASSFFNITIEDDPQELIYIAPGVEKPLLNVVTTYFSANTFDYRGMLYTLDQKILFILNENFYVTEDDTTTRYVVIPINYKEYDREMSKAYAQPLKKQAWRLFQNNSTGYDIASEIILNEAIFNKIAKGEATGEYKIRYVQRPTPIILTKLPEGLDIDGYTEAMECSLNPILHHDILEQAVRLVLAIRGRAQSNDNNNRQ